MQKRLKTEKIFYEDIGDVVFARSKRARRLSISVAPYRAVRVSFPNSLALRQAREYFEKNLVWVQGKVKKAAEIEEKQDKMLEGLIKPIEIKKEAQILYNRLAQLAALHGYKFNKVSIRNQKTRWASCSCQNNISLNINLTILPRHLIDYVLLHELAHTKVKNHSKEFWQHLNTTTNMQAKQLDKELSRYSIPQLNHHKQNQT